VSLKETIPSFFLDFWLVLPSLSFHAISSQFSRKISLSEFVFDFQFLKGKRERERIRFLSSALVQMGTPEFPNLGKHCSVSDCRQLDFLPFTCDCCNQVHRFSISLSIYINSYVWTLPISLLL